uniref:SUI1 domain-containing protein n=1 Tax=Polytomella parva TaxID=51329 RepID=A0A7S0YIN2_9CHLO|mmetsp:Transcript_22848/g.40403  ORF Transcript_22848/g.40403 Transcript_22848/m.40403 type:complete len:114 (+) Transcript_22848:74-415(+)|eukprot:CAMPEP_0175044526 /NCGR_PEP_ID=MMETSP0052_2-20121109/3865_1 /TAXON_ID=51329 ORGANISM="Polytomella parva, Strain SAG 63-3" /NCGR_SAMPLE_ID=MMETSP0052_2 /ASSEMBLY_ACC=CAM_ASM_000194 /LENGTH=113 /DNA_ID=CAMNT_0016307853 /DNA_START=51 /DNA_END=392 /DNA_ORIENTATION=-
MTDVFEPLNLGGLDPLVDVAGSEEPDSSEAVHIRIQQRNGRKCLTTVQGIKQQYDYKKVLKALKKEFCCNGTVVEDPELGQVIQLQGDQRKNVTDFLTKAKLVKKDQIKVHGF